MIPRRKLVVGTLIVVVGGVAALAWFRSEPALPTPPPIVTPAVALLDRRDYGSGDFLVGRMSADKKLHLTVQAELWEHRRAPGTYRYAVSTEKSIPIAPKAKVSWYQGLGDKSGSRSAAENLALDWEGIAGEVLVTIDDGIIAHDEWNRANRSSAQQGGSSAGPAARPRGQRPLYGGTAVIKDLVLKRVDTGELCEFGSLTIQCDTLGRYYR